MKKQKIVFVDDLPFDESKVAVTYRAKKRLYSGRSAYQKIDVFDLEFYGRALFLDGILQTTPKDEFIYHEMLCQTPKLNQTTLQPSFFARILLPALLPRSAGKVGLWEPAMPQRLVLLKCAALL